MNWKTKAFFGRVLSGLPGGSTAYYLAQRYWQRSLPLPDPDFRIRIEAAHWHLGNYERYAGRPLARAVFLEFGTGWDLTIPLLFASAGVRHQVLLDRDPLARVALVASSLARLKALASAEADPALETDPARTHLPASGPRRGDLAPWLGALGIEYRAPADAATTGLPDDLIDAVTNTATLEHVPAPAISQILREMFRILRPGGLLSCEIDLSDHFSHSDPSISPWHFLRFSERSWRRLNSPLLFQNRLRASAYVALARTAGFEIVRLEPGFPPGVEPETMVMPPVHPTDIGGRDRRDLLATSIRLLGRKPGRADGNASAERDRPYEVAYPSGPTAPPLGKSRPLPESRP